MSGMSWSYGRCGPNCLHPDCDCKPEWHNDHKTYLAEPRLRAPFTPEQIDALNAHQSNSRFHPYTCEHWHGEPAERRNLVATKDGWICRYCDYKQEWAHG